MTAPSDVRFTRRALIAGAGMGAVGTTLAARMAWLSIVEGPKYAAEAEGNRVSLRLIPPRRGWIVDRAGRPLALNQPDYRLELLPDQVHDLEATLAAVQKVLPLTADDLARIREDLARQPKFMPVEIAHGLDWATFAADQRQPARPARRPAAARLPPRLSRRRRLRPPDRLCRHADRRPVRAEPRPAADLPRLQDRQGRHRAPRRRQPARAAGARRVEITARGRVVKDLDTRPDLPGATLRLTIDRDLQAYAARRLTDNSASVVVMDCQSGDVLCMISMPAYDPNVFSTRVTAKLWHELQADDHHPLINKSAQGLYPPGSTFKTMTALAILKAGISADTATGCTGTYRLGNAAWHCWSKRGHGRVDLHKAIPQSCDVYFYTFGRAVGADAIAATARQFGLGQKFDLPLPGQSAGIIPDAAWKEARYKKAWGVGDTLNTSIGQGYIVANPLQLAVMASRLASGRLIQPRLFADSRAPAAAPLDVAPDHLAVVRQGMTAVVNSGAGSGKTARLQVDGVQMAGKTGSAQVRAISKADRRAGRTNTKYQPYKFRDHGLFVAFAPADAPRYAISVVLEHGEHGAAAGLIARDVMTYLFEPARAMATLAPIEAAYEAKKRAAIAAAEAAAAAAAAGPVDVAAVAATLTPDAEAGGSDD